MSTTAMAGRNSSSSFLRQQQSPPSKMQQAVPTALQPTQLFEDVTPPRPRSSLDGFAVAQQQERQRSSMSSMREASSNRLARFFPSPIAAAGGPRPFLVTPGVSPEAGHQTKAMSLNHSSVAAATPSYSAQKGPRDENGGDDDYLRGSNGAVDDTPSAAFRLDDTAFTASSIIMSPQAVRSQLAAYEHYESQLRRSIESFETSERDFLARHYALIDPIASLSPLRAAIQQSRTTAALNASSFGQESNASVVVPFDEFSSPSDLAIVESQARARIRVRRELWMERTKEDMIREMASTRSRENILGDLDDGHFLLLEEALKFYPVASRQMVEEEEQIKRKDLSRGAMATFNTVLAPYYEREAKRLRMLREARLVLGDVAFDEQLAREDMLAPFFSTLLSHTECDEGSQRVAVRAEERAERQKTMSEILESRFRDAQRKTATDEAIAFDNIMLEAQQSDDRIAFGSRHRFSRADIMLECVNEWHQIVSESITRLLGAVENMEIMERAQMASGEHMEFQPLRKREKMSRLMYVCGANALMYRHMLMRRYFSTVKRHSDRAIALRLALQERAHALAGTNAMVSRRRTFTILARYLKEKKRGRAARANEILNERRFVSDIWRRFVLRSLGESAEATRRRPLRQEEEEVWKASVLLLANRNLALVRVMEGETADRHQSVLYSEQRERLELTEQRERVLSLEPSRVSERQALLRSDVGQGYQTYLNTTESALREHYTSTEAVSRRRLISARNGKQTTILEGYCYQRLRRLAYDRFALFASPKMKLARRPPPLPAPAADEPAASSTPLPVVEVTSSAPSLADIFDPLVMQADLDAFPGLRLVLDISRARTAATTSTRNSERFPALYFLMDVKEAEGQFPMLLTIMTTLP